MSRHIFMIGHAFDKLCSYKTILTQTFERIHLFSPSLVMHLASYICTVLAWSCTWPHTFVQP